jgi:triosephosphate isomerase (TIM)
MRKKIVAANWKMNLLPAEGEQLINNVVNGLPILQEHKQVIFCVPYTHLALADKALQQFNNNKVSLGAQNFYAKPNGAYTGEISLGMLQTFGVQAVLVGHSERRIYFAENNAVLKDKVDYLLANNITPIFCCGEPLTIREAGSQNNFVLEQLQQSIFHLSAEQIAKVVIAYEPIWAIGTGVTASTQQAQDMHAYLRSAIAAQYNNTIADNITILYGGSCNDKNAAELFSQADVDGGLIGGAALKAETFLPIIQALP